MELLPAKDVQKLQKLLTAVEKCGLVGPADQGPSGYDEHPESFENATPTGSDLSHSASPTEKLPPYIIAVQNRSSVPVTCFIFACPSDPPTGKALEKALPTAWFSIKSEKPYIHFQIEDDSCQFRQFGTIQVQADRVLYGFRVQTKKVIVVGFVPKHVIRDRRPTWHLLFRLVVSDNQKININQKHVRCAVSRSPELLPCSAH